MFYIILTLYPLNKLKPDKMPTVEEIVAAVEELKSAKARVAELERWLKQFEQFPEEPKQGTACAPPLKGGGQLQFPEVPEAAEMEGSTEVVVAEKTERGAAAAEEDRHQALWELFFNLSNKYELGDIKAELTKLVNLKPSPEEISSTLRLLMDRVDEEYLSRFQELFNLLTESSQIISKESATLEATPEFEEAEGKFLQYAVLLYRLITNRE